MEQLERQIENEKTSLDIQPELKTAKATFKNRTYKGNQSRGEREIHPTAEVRIGEGNTMHRDQAAATSMNQFSSIQLSNAGASDQ